MPTNGSRMFAAICTFFMASDDEIIPYKQSIKLLATTNRNLDKTLTTLQGGDHQGLDKFKEYQTKLDELLAN